MLAAVLLLAFTPVPELEPGPPLPPVSDLARFPDKATAMVRCGVLQRQYCALHQQPETPERDAAIRQLDYMIDCWDTLALAHEDARAPARRRALKELRQLIGDADYRRGRMP